MNELVYLRDFYNVVGVQFLHHGIGSGKIYYWYLPNAIQQYLHIGDVEFIVPNVKRKKVVVRSLHYDIAAEQKYKRLPYQSGVASWQIQQICRHLKALGYLVDRERQYKKLMNQFGVALRVDVSIRVNGRLCFIEYNGVHHYKTDGYRYQNVVANMDVKRDWSRKKDVPLLEIPYWWQNNLDTFVDHFLAAVQLENANRDLN